MLLAMPLIAQNGLIATAATGNQIKLDWAASSGFASPQYLVERCLGRGCADFAQIASTTALTFTDSGLGHFTFYAYRIRATDGTNFSTYGRVEGATTVDLVLQSTSGDRCTAVASMSGNPLVTFTCNQNSPGGLPGLRTTTTLNNVNNVPNGVGYGFLSLAASITCLIAVNEDPTNATNTALGQLSPSAIGYSCSTDGASAGTLIISGVWSAK